jgi:hypothetical protein
METLPPSAPLFNAFMQDLAKQLVPLIVAELKHQTNAEGMGMIALDPNNLALPVHSLLTEDSNTLTELIADSLAGNWRMQSWFRMNLRNEFQNISQRM